MLDKIIERMGLPVRCRKCRLKGFVKPGSNYDGWYKSKLFKLAHLRWYCPEHAEIGKDVDERFSQYLNAPESELTLEDTVDELYKLID